MEEILTAIKEADLILVGIGEEFDEAGIVKEDDWYKKGRNIIEQKEVFWLLPYYNEQQRKKDVNADVIKGLTNLAELLQDKNYFVVSTAMNDTVRTIPWKEGRLVMPCGGSCKKQCPDGCDTGLQEVSDEDYQSINNYLDAIMSDETFSGKCDIGICPQCGKPQILNNVYAEKYDENGYLQQWQLYTKWLQGTLNKNVIILELGVGMKFPSVIRWPFEKVAFFNKKAHMYRVNEKLYQLSEELKGKGTAISKNSIDWLVSLC